MIVKQGNKYIIKSKDGKKNLGEYDSKEAANKRLSQIEYFKNKDKYKDGGVFFNDGRTISPILKDSYSDEDTDKKKKKIKRDVLDSIMKGK